MLARPSRCTSPWRSRAPTSRDVVDFGSPVVSASSPTLVGSPFSTTWTSSCAARSIDCVPVRGVTGEIIMWNSRSTNWSAENRSAGFGAGGLEEAAHPVERPREVLARVRVRETEVGAPDPAEGGACEYRNPRLVEQATCQLVGVEAGAGDVRERVERPP